MSGVDPMAGGPGRVLRAGLFASSTVGLAAAAHVVGGGQVPGVVALVAAGLLTLVAYRLAGRRRGPVAIGAAMAVAQMVLHEAFTLWTSASCVSAGGHHAPGTMRCESLAHPMGASPVMTAAHAAAAVLLTLLLVRGERSLWALAAGWRVAIAVVAGTVVVVPPRPARRPRRVAVRRTGVWRAVRPRRGPPAALATA